MSTKIAIIGLGFGQKQIEIINKYKSKNINIVSVVDKDLELAQSIAKKYNVKNYSNDYLSLYKDNNINLVIISTPNNTHFDIFSRLSGLKSDFIIEKPVSVDIETLNKIIDISKKEKLNVYVGHSLRNHPILKKIKGIITSGKLGKVYHVELSLIQNIGHLKNNFFSWYHDSKLEGGQKYMVGTHFFDIISYIWGDVKLASGNLFQKVLVKERVDKLGKKHKVTAEEYFTSSFISSNNTTFSLYNTTYGFSYNAFKFNIYGDKACLLFDDNNGLFYNDHVENKCIYKITKENDNFSIFSKSFKYLFQDYCNGNYNELSSLSESLSTLINLNLLEENGSK